MATIAAIMHPKPSVDDPPTVADLAEHGPAACLAALRAEFDGAHARCPQYRGWTTGTVLGIARQQIGGFNTFVRAEPGDLVLVKRDRYRPWVGCWPHDVAYVPRVGWIVSIAYAGVDDVDTRPLKPPARAHSGPRCAICHRDAHRPGMQGHGHHGHAYQAPEREQQPA